MDEYVKKRAVLDAIAEDQGKRNDAEERVAVEIWDRIKAIPTANVVVLPMPVTDTLRAELEEYCYQRCIDEL